MKRILGPLLSLLLIALTLPSLSYADSIESSRFYEPLAAYGEWVSTPQFGWAWSPYNVAPNWRPYTMGHWIDTDEYGVTWESDEPWGWATFHYGRWYRDPSYGWLWVPGDTWAPAWVAWRQGDDAIGWAPLPPEVTWTDGGFGDIDRFIDPISYVFVGRDSFYHPTIYRDVYPQARNITIIHSTRIVNNYARVNNVIVNHSVTNAPPSPHRTEIDDRTRARIGLTPPPPHTHGEIGDHHNPAPPPAVVNRDHAGQLADMHARENKALQDSHEEQQHRLEEMQAKEKQQASDANRQRELEEQHSHERDALEQEHQRQQQVLSAHQERERKSQGSVEASGARRFNVEPPQQHEEHKAPPPPPQQHEEKKRDDDKKR